MILNEKQLEHIRARTQKNIQQELTNQQDEILKKIRKTLNGETIKEFPSKEEIATRAEIYNIQL
ncbi:MAG: hypothetical protein ACMXYD_03670 [Candidatus Woesearchaeota archaeon]